MVRGLITLTLLLLFVRLTIWAWSARRKATFDALARLPLIDEMGDLPKSGDAP
jgi:cbb3-type cytochrome oxidase subunit 3